MIKSKIEDICEKLRGKITESKNVVSSLNSQKRELIERKHNLKQETAQKFQVFLMNLGIKGSD